jgi:hypothetical protein
VGSGENPGVCQALGRAKGEFEKASKEFTTTATANTSALTTSNVTSPGAAKTKDQILIETAKSFGVSTDGKSREQISNEISSQVKLLRAD